MHAYNFLVAGLLASALSTPKVDNQLYQDAIMCVCSHMYSAYGYDEDKEMYIIRNVDLNSGFLTVFPTICRNVTHIFTNPIAYELKVGRGLFLRT